MAKKSNKSEQKGNDLLENPEVIAEGFSRSEEFLEENKITVFTVIGVVALLITGVFVYNYYLSNQNKLAQDEMFQAVYYFEQDSLDLALRGDGNRYGFLDIIAEYGATEAGNIANFYAGTIYLKKGDYSSAVPFLEDFESSDILVQARAFSLLGDAYMEQELYEDAAAFYVKAADYKPNQYFSPHYLLKAGLAYEKLNDFEQASSRYDVIVSKYAKSTEFEKALKYKARIKGKS